jgi:hypothetical protein
MWGKRRKSGSEFGAETTKKLPLGRQLYHIQIVSTLMVLVLP